MTDSEVVARALREVRSIRPAESQPRTIHEHGGVVAVRYRVHFTNAVEIDDVPIVTLTLSSESSDDMMLRRVAEELGERLAVMDEAQKNIIDLSNQMVSLQDILSNKQARGAFGEIQLKDLVDRYPRTHFIASGSAGAGGQGKRTPTRAGGVSNFELRPPTLSGFF